MPRRPENIKEYLSYLTTMGLVSISLLATLIPREVRAEDNRLPTNPHGLNQEVPPHKKYNSPEPQLISSPNLEGAQAASVRTEQEVNVTLSEIVYVTDTAEFHERFNVGEAIQTFTGENHGITYKVHVAIGNRDGVGPGHDAGNMLDASFFEELPDGNYRFKHYYFTEDIVPLFLNQGVLAFQISGELEYGTAREVKVYFSQPTFSNSVAETIPQNDLELVALNITLDQYIAHQDMAQREEFARRITRYLKHELGHLLGANWNLELGEEANTVFFEWVLNNLLPNQIDTDVYLSENQIYAEQFFDSSKLLLRKREGYNATPLFLDILFRLMTDYPTQNITYENFFSRWNLAHNQLITQLEDGFERDLNYLIINKMLNHQLDQPLFSQGIQSGKELEILFLQETLRNPSLQDWRYLYFHHYRRFLAQRANENPVNLNNSDGFSVALKLKPGYQTHQPTVGEVSELNPELLDVVTFDSAKISWNSGVDPDDFIITIPNGVKVFYADPDSNVYEIPNGMALSRVEAVGSEFNILMVNTREDQSEPEVIIKEKPDFTDFIYNPIARIFGE